MQSNKDLLKEFELYLASISSEEFKRMVQEFNAAVPKHLQVKLTKI